MVVIGGQTLSLLVTLLVTPIAYTFLDDVGALFRRRVRTAGDGEDAERRDALDPAGGAGPTHA